MLRDKSTQLSFYGYIYERVIPKDHFLKLLREVSGEEGEKQYHKSKSQYDKERYTHVYPKARI